MLHAQPKDMLIDPSIQLDGPDKEKFNDMMRLKSCKLNAYT